MDQITIQQQKALAQQKTYQTLKKVTKLLFSVSVFSFLFAQPSWLPCLHSSNLHFSTLPFHLFNHTIDKNCMFLLCNGLLVFLANYSGLVRSLSSSRRNYDLFKVYEYGSLPDSTILEAEKPFFEREVAGKTTDVAAAREREDGYVIEEEKQEIESERCLVSSGGEMEERIISVAEDDEEENSYGSETAGFYAAEREEIEDKMADEEGNNGVLSTEELNRKFDEFIRRMKEEITIDARRTLVVV